MPDLDALAAQMREAQDAARQLAPLTRQHAGCELAAAYEVAHRVHLHRLQTGDRAVSRKVGFTRSHLWPQYDVHQPIWGHVYERTLRPLAANADGVAPGFEIVQSHFPGWQFQAPDTG